MQPTTKPASIQLASLRLKTEMLSLTPLPGSRSPISKSLWEINSSLLSLRLLPGLPSLRLRLRKMFTFLALVSRTSSFSLSRCGGRGHSLLNRKISSFDIPLSRISRLQANKLVPKIFMKSGPLYARSHIPLYIIFDRPSAHNPTAPPAIIVGSFSSMTGSSPCPNEHPNFDRSKRESTQAASLRCFYKKVYRGDQVVDCKYLENLNFTAAQWLNEEYLKNVTNRKRREVFNDQTCWRRLSERERRKEECGMRLSERERRKEETGGTRVENQRAGGTIFCAIPKQTAAEGGYQSA